MGRNCQCVGQDQVIRMELVVDGEVVESVVAARLCQVCRKRYLAPISSLLFLLERLRKVTSGVGQTPAVPPAPPKPPEPSFGEMLEKDLEKTPVVGKEE